MPHPRIRRNHETPPPAPITQLTIRQLWREAKWAYQQYAHTCEQLDERIRLVIAGQRTDLRAVDNYTARRDRQLAALRPILEEIARRVDDHGKRPQFDLDTTIGYLTTRAQAIAEAAVKQNYEIM